MYYVGIDIAKLNHFASVVSSDGEVLVKPFKFTNDNDGFCTLLSALASYDRGSLIIGLESTAHYADNLVEFLVSCMMIPEAKSTFSFLFDSVVKYIQILWDFLLSPVALTTS